MKCRRCKSSTVGWQGVGEEEERERVSRAGWVVNKASHFLFHSVLRFAYLVRASSIQFNFKASTLGSALSCSPALKLPPSAHHIMAVSLYSKPASLCAVTHYTLFFPQSGFGYTGGRSRCFPFWQGAPRSTLQQRLVVLCYFGLALARRESTVALINSLLCPQTFRSATQEPTPRNNAHCPRRTTSNACTTPKKWVTVSRLTPAPLSSSPCT